MNPKSSDYEAGYDPKLGYNTNAFEHRPIHLKAIGSVVRGIGSGIGLVSEAIHHQMDKKHERSKSPSETGENTIQEQHPSQPLSTPHQEEEETAQRSPSPSPSDAPETDEADWALDEAISSSSSSDDNHPLATADPDIEPAQSTHLPHPVILPQRRPGTKTRGFIRAYAPVLSTNVHPPMPSADFGVFLKDLHAAAQASPIFDVVLLASGLGGLYPGVIAMAVSTAVQVAATAGKEMQERWRVNRFLEQANREVWGPRGLFAMVVAYRPHLEGQVGSESVDMSAVAVAKYGGASGFLGEEEGEKGKMDEVKEKMKRLRVASAETRGEREMPVECAELVFPEVDRAAEKAVVKAKKDGEEVSVAGVVDTFKGKTKDAEKWVNEYMDRRAAMEFPFKSKFSDPNAAVNKHLITMITGGRIKAEPLGARRRWERAQRREQRQIARGKLIRPVKRILQEDVLYLMIVNMPSEEELAEARKKIAENKKGKDKKEAR
ncbi:hypothetical protein SLS57_001899 [Botryosphaeria dothidea]